MLLGGCVQNLLPYRAKISSGEIFVTKPKIRHFRPPKSFAQYDFLFFLLLLDYGLQLKIIQELKTAKYFPYLPK